MNKSVCDTCWRENSDLGDNEFEPDTKAVCCPAKLDCFLRYYSLKRKPPEHCPYKLQHAIAAGMKHVK